MAADELTENIKRANGEFAAAIVLLVSLLQKVAERLGDPAFTDAVNAVKENVKGIPGRVPPGCRLTRFEDLPVELRTMLGDGWKGFFNQPAP